MSPLSLVTRRRIMRWGLASASAPLLARVLGAQGLPGGGQLEIRLVQSMYTSDADELEVAQRARPYDLESWFEEWTRVAEKNEKLADGYAAQGFKVTANEHYRRAQDFYGNAVWPLPESDKRMLPGYSKMRETFDKAWQMQRAPFERVKVNF